MKQSPSGLAVARGSVKVVALGVGFVGSLVTLMALIGTFAESGWIRFPLALLVAIGVPAVVADRLLPDDDPARARGLPGDVFALTWLGLTLVFAVPLHGISAKLLTREGDRLSVSGIGPLAKAAYWLAGVQPANASPSEGHPASSNSAAASASAPVPEGSALPPPADAGAPPPRKERAEGDLTPSELFKKLAPAVVTVSIKAVMGEGGGTGFLVDREGTIVTNHHVIEMAKELSIHFMNGATYEEVELLAEDSGQDLALLRVALKKPKDGDPPDAEALTLGDSDKVVVGERAIAIGNPLGLDHTLTDGIISARRVFQGRHWIQMSVPISPGNSGGPLFDMKGKVIGVTTAKVGGPFGENLNLAVPVNVLKQLIKPSYPGRRKFGKGPGSSHW